MKKTERSISQAIAHLPSVELGNHASKWSMEIEVRKGNEPLGRFYIARGGIEMRVPNAKKPGRRMSWKELAERLTDSN